MCSVGSPRQPTLHTWINIFSSFFLDRNYFQRCRTLKNRKPPPPLFLIFRPPTTTISNIGHALITTKDAGGAVTLLKSLAGSTFDSSQLVLTACMGYRNVNETRLQELRDKHRPAVITAIEERSMGLQAWRDSQGLASKLYNFKQDPKSIIEETKKADQLNDTEANQKISHSKSGSFNANDVLISLTGDGETDYLPNIKEQAVWLKVEICRLLEEKRSAELRAEELETALMEMVKQDNRLQLNARVEQLEQEVAELRRALSEKQKQENAMLQVLMRVEQEQRLTEDARRFAEQDAAAQRYATQRKSMKKPQLYYLKWKREQLYGRVNAGGYSAISIWTT